MEGVQPLFVSRFSVSGGEEISVTVPAEVDQHLHLCSSTPFFFKSCPFLPSLHYASSTVLMSSPYYPSSRLPPSPSASPMSTAPLLPIELVPSLASWNLWRPTKSEAPLTPPLSSGPPRRVLVSCQAPTVLPPISYFDRSISRHSPSAYLFASRPSGSSHPATKVTPPPSDQYHHWDKSNASYPLPSVVIPSRSLEPSPSSSQNEPSEDPFSCATYTLDWFGSDSHRSSRFIAEKFCEMICYLWFSTISSSSASPSKRSRVAPTQPDSFSPHSNASTAKLQFSVSPAFVRFMQKVHETTQVSHSVIVLSLHYICRLKARNPFTSGQAGSEYRVAIAALMLANKFVDE